MVDNFTFTPGSGSTGGADDIDGVLYPRVKMIIGANNTNDGDVSSANPMPVSLPAATVTTLTPPAAITGFATQTTLAEIKAKTDNIPALGQALAAGSVPVILPAATITTLTPPAAITGFATETTLASVKTAVETIDNAIAGTEIQADIVAALPAGTNNIGDVDVASIAAGDNNIGNVDIASIAAGNNNIGDVDVASLPATPAGTNAIGKLLPSDVDVTTHTNYARKYYTSAGAATDGIIWSPAAGKRWHVTSLIFQVSADATVTFEDDKAGGDDPVLKGEFKAGSGLALTFDEKYPFASGEDAADLMVTTSAGNIYISVVGFEI